MSKLTNKNFLKLIVIVSLFVFAISLIFVNFQEIKKKQKLDVLENKIEVKESTGSALGQATEPSPLPSVKKIVKKQNPSVQPSPSITPLPAGGSSPSQNPSQNPAPVEVPKQETKENLVNVSINNSSNFSVKVPEGANHCDVLNKALSDGKIQSLNMKYTDSLKTNAVYQINGQGKEDAVWWVYKVNGASPPLGCSLIKANNGDNVLWEYAGPN